MTFIIQRSTGRTFSLKQLEASTLRIGRGANAEIRSENPAVALEHAVIDEDAHGYKISDLGSITGTYVNRKPIESARLAKGDVIEVGDIRLQVQTAEAGKPLFIRVQEREASTPAASDVEDVDAPSGAAPSGETVSAQKVDYAAAYRLRRVYLTRLSVTAALLILVLIFIGEVTQTENHRAFMPGGLSSAHARVLDRTGKPVADDCHACHAPWKGVPDDRCSTCHAQLPHAAREANKPACADCHTEHRGQAQLALFKATQCVECHSNLGPRMAVGQQPRVAARITSFGADHPQFSIAEDRSTLRFNHALHLQSGGVFNARGARETLQCASCHALVASGPDTVDPKPLTFNEACRSCHKLTFDERFPDTEVPHGGDAGLVYGFIVATYSGNQEVLRRSPAEVRRLLESRPPLSLDRRAVIAAEQVIKTRCAQCHDIQRRGGRLAAVPPMLPTSWMTRASFTHTKHRHIDCESCHSSARESAKTSDLLVPGRDGCVGCHGVTRRTATSSECVTCHDYHRLREQTTTRVALAR